MNQPLCGKQRNLISRCLSACRSFCSQCRGSDAAAVGAEGLSGWGELVEPALGCGKSRAALAVVTNRGVFPGHQRAQPPWVLLVLGESLACSASKVQEGAWLCACWQRTVEFVNEFKGSVCHSVDLTGLNTPSRCLPGAAALCGRPRWGFLPGSSFFRQPNQVYLA